MRTWCLLPFIFLAADSPAQEAFSVPPVDAPELAARGPWGVGVRTLDVVHAGQVDILKYDKTTGKAPVSDRRLTLEVWYPAVIPAGAVDAVVETEDRRKQHDTVEVHAVQAEDGPHDLGASGPDEAGEPENLPLV